MTRHILVDAEGIPLAHTLTGANVHDSRRDAPGADIGWLPGSGT